jgi:Cof subfamily protein (haloacid dehalogenase superfamily)
MFVPSLIASDLDGTLLRSDHTVSPRSLAMLARLRIAGIPFVMVTGRPRRWLAPVLEQTGPCGPVVCANGALVIEPTTGAVLAEWAIPAAVLAEATERARAAVPGLALAFAVERGPLMLHEAHYPVRWDLGLAEERSEPYQEIVAGDASKLLIRVLDGDPVAVFAELTAAVGDQVTTTHSGFPGLIEITAAGVTKATGLAWAANHHGADPDRVVAFGDMPNDAPMLRWAGRGVVVADAHPEAFEAADTVTLGNDADGVAAYVEELLDAEVGTPVE